MKHRTTRLTYLGIGLVATGALLVPATSAKAAKKRGRKPAKVQRVDTPLGSQGKRGAGANVVLPFTLVDSSRRPTNVEVEYGVVLNRDADPEDRVFTWFPASEDRQDERNTRKNGKPRKFSTAANVGAAHAYVWSSEKDLETDRLVTLQLKHDDEGRPVEDPNNPGSFEFEDPEDTTTGVKVRFRAVSGKGKRKRVGDWVESDRFSLNNNTQPNITLEGVEFNSTSSPPAADEVVFLNWTAIDADSEDANGNGEVDFVAGEDRNGNGEADLEPLKIHFDYYRVQPGEDPTTFTQEELEALFWQPCTNATGQGDPNTGVPSSPVGLSYQFAWDSVADVGTADAEFIVRGRPLDAKKELGDWVYAPTPFRVENHKIFAPAGPNSTIAGPRVGHTVTNLTIGLENSDPFFPGQSYLVVGGETAPGAGGTQTVDVMLVNALSAETTSADRFTSGDFQLPTPRAWHSATMLDDGRVLIAGGVDGSGNPVGTTAIYDPAQRAIVPGPDMVVARSHHAAVLLPSGDVAFFGGKTAGGTPTSAVEIFQFEPVATGEPQLPNVAAPSMSVAQHSLHAVLLPDQTVLVTGGIDAADNPVQTAQIFDPFNDDDPTTPRTKDPDFLSTPGLAMLEGRKLGAAVPLLDGNVLFAGGASSPSKASMELFNHLTGAFEAIDVAMPDGGRSDMIATLLGDGTVLLAGGTSDPDLANAALVPQADVFRLGARTGNTWTGDFLPVNGDLRAPRRGARSVAIDNGRVVVVGGQLQDGSTTATSEVFVPEKGSNLRPSARTVLQSNRQSWAFGAPILYRLSDPEQDAVRVVVQWSDDAKLSWEAASAQPDTIAGDTAELTANLESIDVDDTSVAINNFNFAHDHIYIWRMTADIERPPFGGEITPINVRVIPFGAVRGVEGASVPITILFNTKVITSILPLEDDDGIVTPNVGGDIRLNVHLRDIDGTDQGPGTEGDEASLLFEYAVDSNRNNQIDTNEFWIPMTPKGAPANDPAADTNPKMGLTTYNDSFLDSDPVNRPADQGWTIFDWDSVFDLGVPATEFDNIWVRATPSDADIGLATILRNVPGEDDTINVVPHPEALRLLSYNPRGGVETDVISVNQPLELNFQGTVSPASINGDTVEIFRGSSRVTGQYTVVNDEDNNSSVVTFFPDLQDLEDSQPSIGIDDAATVFFPLTEYRIRIPAYEKGNDPLAGNFLRPLVGVPDTYSTFRLVQNVLIDGDQNARYRFSTTTALYDDGQPVTFGASVPVGGGTLASDGESSFSVNHAVDVDSVLSPNVEMVIRNGGVDSVIPGTWSVDNVRNADGTTSSSLSFEPLIQVPPSATVTVRSGNGLIGTNGTTATGVARTFTVTNYGAQVTANNIEDFDDQDLRSTAETTADWGTDPCNPNVLTGLQGDTSALPAGGVDLEVFDGGSEVITGTLNDYDSITIHPGGEVVVRASSAATIRVDGDFIVGGTLSFRGEDGTHGHHGATAERWVRNSTRNVGTRAGGRGFNGGFNGGNSLNTSTSSLDNNRPGLPGGGGTAGGEGGFAPSERTVSQTNAWFYGGGGGAGGGHATRGLNGGSNYHNTSGTTNPAYGQQSTGGLGNVGSANFTSGPTVGGAGGGGGSSGYNNIYRYLGGAGGASAGAVTVITNGVFEIEPTGLVDGRGGSGGNSATRAGSGGAGAGGGFLVRAGGGAKLNGIVDVRGGEGGVNGFAEWTDRTAYWYALNHGANVYGGDGGLGRVRVEASNFGNIAEVRVLGALETHKIDSIPAFPESTPTAQDSVFNGSGTATRDFGNTSQLFFTSLNVAAGKTAILKGDQPLTIFVRDDVVIDGTIVIDGDSAMPTTLSGFQSTSSISTTTTGASGQLGGGDGGDPWANGAPNNRRGSDGEGAAGGKNLGRSNSGYNLGSYTYLTGDSGGGGGGNATPGTNGSAPYSVPGIYRYEGAANDVVTSGFNGLKDHNGGEPGGLITAEEMSLDNLREWSAGGGGGGNSGADQWTSSSSTSYGLGGIGGGAAGTLAIVTPGSITINGTLQGRGGEGRAPNAAYLSSYSCSGGGGGAGGNFYLIGDDVTIRPATSETGNGATIDLTGGLGGGRRQVRGRAGSRASSSQAGGAWLTYPAYNSHGSFGGSGGFGRLKIDYVTSLNGEAGTTLVNKWGMTQTAFHDNRNHYRALAGSFTSGCYVAPRGNVATSNWIDLSSVVPNVTGLSATSSNTGSVTLTLEGAQSHPHNLGPDGVGEPDASSASGFAALGGGLSGRRWVRWKAVFTRGSTSGPNPEITAIDLEYLTDPDDE